MCILIVFATGFVSFTSMVLLNHPFSGLLVTFFAMAVAAMAVEQFNEKGR